MKLGHAVVFQNLQVHFVQPRFLVNKHCFDLVVGKDCLESLRDLALNSDGDVFFNKVLDHGKVVGVVVASVCQVKEIFLDASFEFVKIPLLDLASLQNLNLVQVSVNLVLEPLQPILNLSQSLVVLVCELIQISNGLSIVRNFVPQEVERLRNLLILVFKSVNHFCLPLFLTLLH